MWNGRPDGRHSGVLDQVFDGTRRLLGLLPTGQSLVDAGALAAHPRLPDALAAYSDMRRAHLRYYTLASWALNAVFQHDRRRMALPRDHLIGPAARVPWLRRLMLETLAGVRTGPFSRLDGDWLTPR